MDLDFVGSPLLVPGTSCGPMIVAATKNDTVYGWRRDAVAAGWAWKVAVEPYAVADPFVSQLAWSTATSSVYAVTGTELVRIKIGANCSASVVWRRPLGTHTENGSPTVAGNVVWFANNGTQKLVGYNATTGARVFSAPLGGTTLEAPAIVGGRLLDRDVHRSRRRIHDRARGASGSHRGDQAHVDELGRRPARLAGTAGRRLRDRQCGQELAADLSSTRSRSRSGSRRPRGSSRPGRPRAPACARRGSSGRATRARAGTPRRRSAGTSSAAEVASTSGRVERCERWRCRPRRAVGDSRHARSSRCGTGRSLPVSRRGRASRCSCRRGSTVRAGTRRRA